MGVGYLMYKWKYWVLLPNHHSTIKMSASTQLPFSCSLSNKEDWFKSSRPSTIYVAIEENRGTRMECPKALHGSLVSLTEEKGSTTTRHFKMNIDEGLSLQGRRLIDTDLPAVSLEGNKLIPDDASQFSVVMENLKSIEDIFIRNSDSQNLETEILTQIERLGALKLFETCLQKTLISTSDTSFMSSDPLICPDSEALKKEASDHNDKVVVRSSIKRRKHRRVLVKGNMFSIPSSTSKPPKPRITVLDSLSSCSSKSSPTRRSILVKGESEMTRGVQDITALEKIRASLEEKLGRPPGMSSWAEAVGVDTPTLKRRLHFGSCCRDNLLKATHPLVAFIAKGYHRRGVCFDELIQEGKLGVLQGAEKFDQTRGYRFSTYVQYWIRKCLSMFVMENSQWLQIPASFRSVITKTEKARSALYGKTGDHPTNYEIAEFTGIPLKKVMLARKCSRQPVSLDRKIGDNLQTSLREIIPDPCIESPEVTVMRRCMIKELHGVLGNLHAKERQVLLLRYGFGDGRCRSLGEIGIIMNVSREWIRKIEQSAFTKLRKEEVRRRLVHYKAYLYH